MAAERIGPVEVFTLAPPNGAIPAKRRPRALEADERSPRRAPEGMGQHPMSVAQHEPRIVRDGRGQMANLHPALRLPAHEFDLVWFEMCVANYRGRAVVLLDLMIDDESLAEEVARHRRSRVR